MKFQKKPVVIEAMQFTEESKNQVFNWITCNHYASWDAVNVPAIVIMTLEGEMRAAVGDWIIKGVKGEFYPIKPDIFTETYSPADEQEQRIPGLPPYMTHAWVRVKCWYPEITRPGVYDEESKLWTVAGWRGFLYTCDIELVAPMAISSAVPILELERIAPQESGTK